MIGGRQLSCRLRLVGRCWRDGPSLLRARGLGRRWIAGCRRVVGLLRGSVWSCVFGGLVGEGVLHYTAAGACRTGIGRGAVTQGRLLDRDHSG